jgi:hypothetical protein
MAGVKSALAVANGTAKDTWDFCNEKFLPIIVILM